MKQQVLTKILGNADIYLIDQIMKGRYQTNDIVLDAGCGSGRNLQYFHESGHIFYAIDTNAEHIEYLQKLYPKQAANFTVSSLENMSFLDNKFDHIICNAVLHFARSNAHFKQMFAELVRVLKKNGSLFIRMTSDIGVEGKATLLKDGVYFLPDETERFLLTRSLLYELMETHQLSFLELVKSTNVQDLRSMTTLVLRK
ncbi:Ubiquinone/menaquinone biosynthesis C-methyltransferase UbiE [Kordia antarctica]|uniref:Ubiquinone/menaquinone biosynthesis C-methyltransferase UbiE n=1 Tax=Kordia antarctica TaxID=1218801 RepID=A0A7L4ZK43_9FLAO|nr:class I SAM-dependent methyltransferase [Kordia antarctica]QHI36837.1 Ubiquinone/menaquinone biosynthesis C-methyltransferase UbiE [Kordia antarctica]